MVNRSETSSRQDKRRQQTRAKLVAAAGELLVERGAAGFTVGDVTDRADVGLGTFYHHFANKELLIDELGDSLGREIGDQIRRIDEDSQNAAVALARAVRFMVEWTAANPARARLMVDVELANQRLREHIGLSLAQVLARGVGEQRFSVPVTPETVVAVGAMVLGVVSSRLGGLIPAADRGQHLAGMVLAAVGVEAPAQTVTAAFRARSAEVA